MVQTDAIEQTPAPGVRQLHFVGDTVTFTLTAPVSWDGQAWLRTSLGHVYSVRREIIRQVDARGKSAWARLVRYSDDPVGKGCFSLTNPLTEVGHFEAKVIFSARTALILCGHRVPIPPSTWPRQSPVAPTLSTTPLSTVRPQQKWGYGLCRR
jgi:hypothetical protein